MQAFFIWPVELLESNRRCLRNAGLIQEERGRPQRSVFRKFKGKQKHFPCQGGPREAHTPC